MTNDLPPINPAVIETLWGVSAEATGASRIGVSAALWALGEVGKVEVVRPACNHTHVVSLWPTGFTSSDLYLDGRRRFSDLRHAGNFQLSRAGEAVRAILTKPTGSCLDVYMPITALDACLEADFEGKGANLCLLPAKLEIDSEITGLGLLLRQEMLDQAPGSRAVVDGVALLLSVALIRRWSNLAQSVKLPKSGLADWQKRRALARLRDDLADEASVNEIAREVGMSPFHFIRSFKKSIGIAPHQFRIEQRMQKARSLLCTTSLDVSEVAAAVGYDDPSYFARLFRRRIGVAPLAYRLKCGVH